MERVFTFAEEPTLQDHWIVVAVGEPAANQRHICIGHRDGASRVQFLHLAWHFRLRNEATRPDYLKVWTAPGVPAKRQRILAAFCRRVWRKNEKNGIPYAFSNPEGTLDPATGDFLIGPTRFGLTCASFVLAAFHAAGLQLAKYESWPADRKGDREWQQSIIAQLENGQAEVEHMNHLRTEIGAVRFRPEEVAAATAIAPPPASFEHVESLGQRMVERIRNQPDQQFP